MNKSGSYTLVVFGFTTKMSFNKDLEEFHDLSWIMTNTIIDFIIF